MTPMSQLTNTKTTDAAQTVKRWPESVPPNIYGHTPPLTPPPPRTLSLAHSLGHAVRAEKVGRS